MKNNIITTASSSVGEIMNRNIAKVALAAAVAVLVGGCGESIDISHVGPNVVEKKIFDGEWYFRTTIVDKQAQDTMNIVGEEGGVSRLMFIGALRLWFDGDVVLG